MGKKAKLKKIRREASSQLSSSPQLTTNFEPTQFVKEIEKLGYQLNQSKHSPEMPTEKIEPQL